MARVLRLEEGTLPVGQEKERSDTLIVEHRPVGQEKDH